MIGTAQHQLMTETTMVERTTTKVAFPQAGLVVTFSPFESPEYDSRRYVNVDEKLALAADPKLAELVAQEENLGDLRWCTRVENGGSNPEIDALYDEMNAHWLGAYHAVAVQAVRLLADAELITGDVERAISGARGDAYAGCESCKCSPGVTLGASLYAELAGGRQEVNLYVTPMPTPEQPAITDGDVVEGEIV